MFPFAPESWSRETGSAVSSRASLPISILRQNLVPTYGIPSEFRGGALYLLKPRYAIGSVPSLMGHAMAYRWHSIPRIRRHRACKPQGSSKRVLLRQVTMDQFIRVSFSHTHYNIACNENALHLQFHFIPFLYEDGATRGPNICNHWFLRL